MSTVQVSHTTSTVEVSATRPRVEVGTPSIVAHNDLSGRDAADAHPIGAISMPFAAGTLTAPSVAIGALDYGFSSDGTAIIATIGGVPRHRFGSSVTFHDNYGSYTSVSMRRANGTYAAPTKTLSGDTLGLVQFRGAYDVAGVGTFDGIGAYIRSYATEDYNSATNRGAYLTMFAIPTGSGSAVECLRVDGSNVTAYRPIITPAGSAASPSLCVYTGAYGFFYNSGIISTSVAGVERIRLNSDRIEINANASAWYSPGIPSFAAAGLSFYGADGGAPRISCSSVANSGKMTLRRTNGTAAVPTTILSGEALGSFAWDGYDGANFHIGKTHIQACADGDWSDATNCGTYLRFYGVPAASVTSTEWLRLRNGQALAADGAVGSPSFSFISDQDTGVYRVGANILGLATAGALALQIDASQNLSPKDGGNVILGTTTGTKIGTATAQKIGFWNATPVIQPAAAGQAAPAAQGQAALTDSTGGTASTTLATITAGATYVQADLTAIKNALASLAARLAEVRTDVANIKTFQTAARTALVNTGLIKGAA